MFVATDRDGDRLGLDPARLGRGVPDARAHQDVRRLTRTRRGSRSARRSRGSTAFAAGQAHGARGVAIAAGLDVTAAGDPGLAAVALLAQNLAEGQVWVCETLGPLASDTEQDARLRETLRLFLRHELSYKAAAEDLLLHSNSVKYRVQRAVERRGRPIDDDRLDVEIALLMCHWYGNAVLAPA